MADEYNEPGRPTALIGYEWTAIGGYNLHRNVIFRPDSSAANRTVPFPQHDSKNPEDLWKHLAEFERRTRGNTSGTTQSGSCHRTCTRHSTRRKIVC